MVVDRRQLLLGGLVVVVLAVAAWQFWPSERAAPGDPPQPRAGVRQGAQAEVPKPVAPVKLNTLGGVRSDPGEAARNPFRFSPRAAPPPPRPVGPPPEEAQFRVPAAPQGPPPLPPIALKLIGVLERANGVKWAVLSDGKSTPMYGREGEMIDGRFVIVKIGSESIEMTYADGRGRQVIRLTGQ
jgi:hypothetical protein